MYQTIYIENGVRSLPKVERIVDRYPQARLVPCDSYTEVFNRNAQDFRLQKRRPALILAQKKMNHVLPAPSGYGVGSVHNYYFSTMLNCVYDCRYCFLQGMYRSANHVLFVNFDAFRKAIEATLDEHDDADEVHFFSGYDCDSLAMEPVAGLASYFIEAFERYHGAMLELRTKSTQIRSLLGRAPSSNVIVAFSLTPQEVSSELEDKVPSVKKRIEAMASLQSAGWKIGLRFDPMIYQGSYREAYGKLFEMVFGHLDHALIHSASVGAFRLPCGFHKKMANLYPDSKFLALPFDQSDGMVSYPRAIEREMLSWCINKLSQYIDSKKIYEATIVQ